MPYHKIVFGADFSPAAEPSARWLVRCFAPGAELTLVHALELPHLAEFLVEPSRRRQVAELARRGAEERLAELAGALDGAQVRTVAGQGRPADRIAAVAEEVRGRPAGGRRLRRASSRLPRPPGPRYGPGTRATRCWPPPRPSRPTWW